MSSAQQGPYCNLEKVPLNRFPLEIEDFLRPVECARLIKLAQKSALWKNFGPPSQESAIKTTTAPKEWQSYDLWIEKNDKQLIKKLNFLRDRVKKSFCLYKKDFGLLAIRKMRQTYPHYDRENGKPVFIYTLLFYLNDNFTGGATHYVNVNKVVQPKTGKLCIHRNLMKNEQDFYTKSWHQGLPVTAGEKWICLLTIRVNHPKPEQPVPKPLLFQAKKEKQAEEQAEEESSQLIPVAKKRRLKLQT